MARVGSRPGKLATACRPLSTASYAAVGRQLFDSLVHLALAG